MALTSSPDFNEQSDRQRAAQLQALPPDEADWRGLLYGLAAAIGGIAILVGAVHLYLRYFATLRFY